MLDCDHLSENSHVLLSENISVGIEGYPGLDRSIGLVGRHPPHATCSPNET
jgi:hypothetical protein